MVYPNVRLEKGITVGAFAVLGRPPVNNGVTMKTDGCGPLIIGQGCVIGAGAVLYSNTRIGRYTMICDTACIREMCIIGDMCLIAQGVKVNVGTVIGERTKVMDNTALPGRQVIGDDVLISNLVSGATDNSMALSAVEDSEGPRIGNGAKIGHGAHLNPHIVIGEGAIVGAGAVVTRSVGHGQRVLGNPARRK